MSEVFGGIAFFTFAWFCLVCFLLLPYALVRLWSLLRRRRHD